MLDLLSSIKPRPFHLLAIASYTLVAVLISVCIGLFETPDSFIYAGLGEYLFRGTLLPFYPFHMTTPETLFGPVYSTFLFPFLSAPSPVGVISVPLLQLLLLGLSAYITRKILSTYLPRPWALAGGLLVILLPWSIIYATLLMSETLTMFWVALFVYLLFLRIHKKRNVSGWLLLTGALAALTRYAYISFFLVGICICLPPPSWRKKSEAFRKVTLSLPNVIGGITGIFLLSWWIFFNWQHLGFIGFSSVTGRHLYDNVVYLGKILPTHPNGETQLFMAKFPNRSDMFVPWWEAQRVFYSDFENGKLTEKQIDHLFLAMAVGGIRDHPVGYLANVLKASIVNPLTPPYLGHILADLSETKDSCRILWNKNLCTAALEYPTTNSLFASFITLTKSLYPIVPGILFVLAIIGITRIFFREDLFLKTIAGLFLIQHVLQSATELIEGRFIIPLYPIYSIMIVYGIKTIASFIQYWKSFQSGRKLSFLKS